MAYGLVSDRAIGQMAIWQTAGLGLLLASISLGGLFVLQSKLGWLHWRFLTGSPQTPPAQGSIPPWVLPLLSTLGLALWVSCTEELVFRGFVFTTLQQEYAPWIAASIASLIFAVLHLVWEGKEGLPQLLGLWLMGMVLSLARWVDQGSLGLAIGLHAGWVWVIAYLDTMQAMHYSNQAPSWLIGWGGKPLAGAMGLIFLLGTGLVLWNL
ncbi:MAG TPA: CPBP family intramembrane glutamic endopeptidase, partial [Allocoleopsis sp.]